MRARLTAIENLISRDPGHRNIFGLVIPGQLRLAALSLLSAEKVGIVTGFPVLSKGVGETDGPPGALALGQALGKLGIEVVYLTDELNRPLLEAIGAGPLPEYHPGLIETERLSHLVAVERPGRGRDGRYYNMFGQDISHLVEPLDELFLKAEDLPVTTIGIGDGGNEIGLGRILDGVTKAVDKGWLIGSTVPTDYLILSGVSNWGAYGLVGALSVLAGQDLLPSASDIRVCINSMLAAGSVDGVTSEAVAKVDGLDLRESIALVEEIRSIFLLPSEGCS